MHSTGKPLRAAWYSRVSSEIQVEAVTIDLQRDYAKKFFALHEEMALIETYEDDGVSGSIPVADRPGGKRLLADAKAGRFDVIVFYSFDRIVRSTLDLLQFHEQLRKHGVELRSATQPFDTTTAFGKAFMTLLAMVAELEREQIRDRTTRGKLRSVRNARPPGGRAPLGYRWQKGAWEIDEEEAKIIRRIFEMATSGMSSPAIAKWLISHNVPTLFEQRGVGFSDWRASTVLRLLHSPTYRGTFYWNATRSAPDPAAPSRRKPRPESERISVSVPAIVSEEVWYAAQAVIEENRSRSPRTGRNAQTHDYLLKGLVRCNECDLVYLGSLTGRTQGGTKTKDYPYYRHPWRPEELHRCTGVKGLSARNLEAVVWEEIAHFLRNPGEFLALLRERLQPSTAPATSISTTLNPQERIAGKTAARASIIRLLARELITEEDAERELLQLEGELRALEAERDAMAQQALDQSQADIRLLEAGEILARLRQGLTEDASADTKRAVIRALVKEVRILRGKEVKAIVEIRYRPDPFLESAGEFL